MAPRPGRAADGFGVRALRVRVRVRCHCSPDPAGLLDLPGGFGTRSSQQAGEPRPAAASLPDRFDGTAAFAAGRLARSWSATTSRATGAEYPALAGARAHLRPGGAGGTTTSPSTAAATRSTST